MADGGGMINNPRPRLLAAANPKTVSLAKTGTQDFLSPVGAQTEKTST
jgi:hypothetical protein